jgi:uncharacterized damage-inducible protein DinB
MRPKENEYDPYYQQYIDSVKGDDILLALDKQIITCVEFLQTIPEEKKTYSYDKGKWTIAEVLGHIIDTERIMTLRALWFARNEPTPLPGFEQDNFIKYTDFNKRTIQSQIEEWTYLRKSNNILYASFSQEALKRRGVASNKQITVLALLFIIAGHMNHHLDILKERYLKV